MRRILELAVAGLAIWCFAKVIYNPADAWITPDGYYYIVGARGISAGEGFISSCGGAGPQRYITGWPPLFPAAIALAMKLGAGPLQAGVLVGACCWLLLVAGTYLIGRQLAGQRAALAAALLLAVNSELFAWSRFVLSDICFAAAAVGILIYLMRRAEAAEWRARSSLAAGLSIGALSLVRYAGIVLCVPAAWVVWRSAKGRARWKQLLLVALSAGVPLGVWYWRQHLIPPGAAEPPTAVRIFVFQGFAALWKNLHAPAETLLQTLVPGLDLQFPSNLHGFPQMGVTWQIMCAAAWIGIGAVSIRVRAARERGPGWQLAGITAVVYLGFLLGTKAWGAFTDPIGGRFLLPLFPLLFVFLLQGIESPPRRVRVLLAAAFVIIFSANVVQDRGVYEFFRANHTNTYNYRVSLLYSLGYCAQERGQYHAALDLLSALHADVSNFKRSRFLAGWSAQKIGDLSRAVEEYRQAIVQEPGYVQSYINLGYAYIELRRYQAAKEAFNGALRLDAANGNARAGLRQAEQPRSGAYSAE